MRSYHSEVDPVVSRPERYLFGGMSLHDLHLDTPGFVSLFLDELIEVVPRLVASDVPLDRVRRPLPRRRSHGKSFPMRLLSQRLWKPRSRSCEFLSQRRRGRGRRTRPSGTSEATKRGTTSRSSSRNSETKPGVSRWRSWRDIPPKRYLSGRETTGSTSLC